MKRPPNDKAERIDAGIDYLLSFDGELYEYHDGDIRIKFEATRVAVTPERPWGVRYSLTRHARDGLRLLGFDNAHGGVKPTGSMFKFAGKRFPYDHRHRYPTDPGVFYKFESGYKLVADFYKEVNRILEGLSL